MHIVIIYGGQSPEHDVSLSSAQSIIRALNQDAYESITLLAIAKDGVWYMQEPHTFQAVRNGKALDIQTEQQIVAVPGKGLYCNDTMLSIDMAFLAVHGKSCEDGILQGFLDMLHVPYVGCGVKASALCMDKAMTKLLWQQLGIPVLPFMTVENHDFAAQASHIFHEAQQLWGTPLCIKPVSSGSSFGVNIVYTSDEFIDACQTAYVYDTKIMIEKALVHPREIECAVLGYNEVEAFVPGEVENIETFYDYETKYYDERVNVVIPSALSEHMTKQVQDLAKHAFYACGATGFSRVDFLMDRETEEIFVSEINTLPGLTERSMFPMLCENAGLKYGAWIDRMINPC